MTRDELLAKLARQRAHKLTLTWAQFTSAISSLSPAQKAALLDTLNRSDGKAVATLLDSVVKKAKTDLARAEVDAIAADDTITVPELLGLMG